MENIKLNINEIFYSIQGEGTRAGLPCVFVRLQGCPLRCKWCDTAYALELNQKEKLMSYEEISSQIKTYNCNFIELTGGEPLAQPAAIGLLDLLIEAGYVVAIETNGHSDISPLNPSVIKIMDIKCPGSGMSKFNNYNNFKHITKNDEVKFVVSSDEDFDWACDIINNYNLTNQAGSVLFSPAFGLYEPIELSKKILGSGLRVRMQIQMHKFIWHPDTRGV